MALAAPEIHYQTSGMGNDKNHCFVAHNLIQMSKAVVDSLLSVQEQGDERMMRFFYGKRLTG